MNYRADRASNTSPDLPAPGVSSNPERDREASQGYATAQDWAAAWSQQAGVALNPMKSLAITIFIPSSSSSKDILVGDQRKWINLAMAILSKHFGGATRLGGFHEGLFFPKGGDPAEFEFPAIVEAYAEEEKIMDRTIMSEIGNFMFGMAEELGQYETLIVVGDYKYNIENDEKYGRAGAGTNKKKLQALGLSGDATSWGFLADSYQKTAGAFSKATKERVLWKEAHATG